MVYARRIMLIAVAALLWVPAARAENEGLADLDKATEAKLTASNLEQLSDVIKLLDSAVEKGLDKENGEFANQLLVASLVQRGTLMHGAVFNKAGPDPRWPQIRKLALEDLQRAVKLDPEQTEVYFMIGQLNVLPGGDRDAAIDSFGKVAEQENAPKEKRAKAYTMRAALQKEDAKRVADYNEAIKLLPDGVEAIRARGLYYLLKEEHKKAIPDLEKAAKLDPKHGATFEALGLAQFVTKQNDKALKSFNQAIRLSPDSPSPYLHRARIYIVKEEYKSAIKDLSKSLELEPRALAVLMLRAQVHGQAGDVDSALADVQKALNLKPDWVQAKRVRAEILAGSSRLSEAIGELEQLRIDEPTDSQILQQLALYYIADERPRQAIKTFDVILEADENNWMARRSRGDALLSIAKQGAAIADYEKVLKANPEHSGTLNNLAWVLATSPDENLRDGKRAIELATKACEVTEYKEGHILSTLAAAYAETGNFEKAREWSQKAIATGREDQKEALTKELQSYKEEKPWRELQNVAEKSPGDKKPTAKAPARTADF